LIARARRRGLAQQRGRRGYRCRSNYQAAGTLFEHGREPVRIATGRDSVLF
jgi:hypothetical protein